MRINIKKVDNWQLSTEKGYANLKVFVFLIDIIIAY